MSKLYKNKHANNIFLEVFSTEANGVAVELAEVNPNTTDAAQEKHVPVVAVNGNRVEVTVGSVEHPMLENHYITGIYIETGNGGQFKRLNPGEAPKAVFILDENDKFVAAYEHCNLHGTWKA